MTKTQPVLNRMLEWRDGQPGCMGCLSELYVGSMVYHPEMSKPIYCSRCAVLLLAPKKKITFNKLMKCVKYYAALKKEPYQLVLEGEGFAFADTVQIIPFVRKLGWTVEGCP